MHFVYVFILQFCTTLHVSNDHFVHHQVLMMCYICSSVQTMQTCLTDVSGQAASGGHFLPTFRDRLLQNVGKKLPPLAKQ
jgi:hypothetical protein